MVDPLNPLKGLVQMCCLYTAALQLQHSIEHKSSNRTLIELVFNRLTPKVFLNRRLKKKKKVVIHFWYFHNCNNPKNKVKRVFQYFRWGQWLDHIREGQGDTGLQLHWNGGGGSGDHSTSKKIQHWFGFHDKLNLTFVALLIKAGLQTQTVRSSLNKDIKKKKLTCVSVMLYS